MNLDSIELQGYKTFAGRTQFDFAGAITCIVGPNGSGKSNIADAIRWVLGEQSYRLLRGKRTEDMIFSGSEQRARAGMASATIVFDNTSGWLPIDFSEVSITRRAYRDGQNEYLINNQRVRLRDVSELLSNSGLSERTYTVIGQGLVDAALALKAEERRRLFEEAAGIALYRSRREDAQRRLENTSRNLERVQDILAELKPRLRSLERQARRAQQYEQVQSDLRLLLREWYGYHWYQALQELGGAREESQKQEVSLEAARHKQEALDHDLTASRERVHGIRAQLSSWLRESSRLQSQRETITRDLAVSDERMRALVVQRQEAADELARLDQQLEDFHIRLSETNQEVERLETELEEARVQVQATSESMQSMQAARKQAEDALQELRQKRSDLLDEQAHLRARLVEHQSQIDRQRAAWETAGDAVLEADRAQEEAQVYLDAAEQTLNERVTAREILESELKVHRQRIAEVETTLKTANEEQSGLQAKFAGLQAQLEVLEGAEKALVGYASGTQLLLKSAEQGRVAGVQGALSSHLDVPEEIETAIATALGEYLEAILLGAGGQVDKALDILLRETIRGALLPVDALIPPSPLEIDQGTEGVVGVAADLVKAPSSLRLVLDLLLGQVVVVRDRAAAREVLLKLPPSAKAVTLQGEVFHTAGPIVVGQEGQASTLGRPRQRRQLQEQIAEMRREGSLLDQRVNEIEENINVLQGDEAELIRALESAQRQEKAAVETHSQALLQRDQAQRQAQWQREQRQELEREINQGELETKEIQERLTHLSETITATQAEYHQGQTALTELSVDEFQTQIAYWRTQAAVAERALDDLRARFEERQANIDTASQQQAQIRSRIEMLDGKMADLKRKMEVLQVGEEEVLAQIDALQAQIEPAEAKLESSDEERATVRVAEASARHELSVAERQYNQAQLNLTRRQETLDILRERIEDDFGLVAFEYSEDVSGPNPLPFGEMMVEQFTPVAELSPDLDKTIRRQRAQLRRMGAINPEAQSEYQEVKDRFEFMTNQVEDLNKAEVDIKAVIVELDTLMEEEFRKTFDAVAAEFREIFTRLFGGGSARLLLTDPDDLTETGIDIEARLPGRRTQGLSLLSGGERSLTATALVFALLRVSPTPFCVLDEVDAMLDEANVGRFRELLRELSENTQFIVITHNRNTVQAADVIYGVTMGRDSVSQVISLKLDEVAEVV
jgi:chromosome segregation protein